MRPSTPFFEMGANFGRSIIGSGAARGRAVLRQRPLSMAAPGRRMRARWCATPTSPSPSAGGLSDGLSGLHDRARCREGGNRHGAIINRPPFPGAPSSCNAFDVAGTGTDHPCAARRRPVDFAAAGRRIEAAYRADIDAPIRKPSWRSRTVSTNCVRRFVRLNGSGSRRSSIRARRARCCANSRGSPSRSAPPGPRPA